MKTSKGKLYYQLSLPDLEGIPAVDDKVKTAQDTLSSDSSSKPPPSTVQLIHGDCLDVMPTLKKQSVDYVFADLPYEVLSCKWDSVIDLSSLWREIKRISKPGTAQCFTATQPFTTSLVNSNTKSFRYDLVWCKHSAVGHLLANKRPMRIHETVCVFYDKQPTYNAQKTSGHLSLPRTCRAEHDKSYGAKIVQGRQDSNGTRNPVSVLSIKADGQRRRGWANVASDYFHPTQKPVALLEWLIKSYTRDGDTILDPTAGSGTTAIAAMNVGNRHVICIEKDPTYYDIMCKRVAEHRKALG